MQSLRILLALKICALAALAAALVLTAGPAARPAGAAFPGENGLIAFASDRIGFNNWDIYVMNASGGGQTMLAGIGPGDLSPSWSPDGSQIAFQDDLDVGEIYVINADGSEQTNLTNSAAHDGGPAWSPDGSKIAFTSTRDGNYEIHVMNADGSGEVNLTNNPAQDSSPAWSPDGSKIAFTSNRDGNYEIYVMSADGSGQTNLTNSGTDDSSPEWSPDGSKIAFTRAPPVIIGPFLLPGPSSGPIGSNEVFVMNADGSSQTNRTNHSANDATADWQPLPVPVGGMAELPRLDGGQADVAGAPLEESGSSGPSVGVLAGIAVAVAASALGGLGGAAWWARRRKAS